jgi:hypothetical protein
MKTVIEMAREAGLVGGPVYARGLERFAELVRADEREKYKWDIHSCGPTCQRYACVAMREAVEAEREACHALRQTLPNPYDHCQVSAHAHDMAIAAYGAAIRARSNT